MCCNLTSVLVFVACLHLQGTNRKLHRRSLVTGVWLRQTTGLIFPMHRAHTPTTPHQHAEHQHPHHAKTKTHSSHKLMRRGRGDTGAQTGVPGEERVWSSVEALNELYYDQLVAVDVQVCASPSLNSLFSHLCLLPSPPALPFVSPPHPPPASAQVCTTCVQARGHTLPS